MPRREAVRAYRKRRKTKIVQRGRGLKKGRVYVVRKGDSLWKIAKRYYGDGKRYRLIAQANRRKISNPNRIRPRQRLVVPWLK